MSMDTSPNRTEIEVFVLTPKSAVETLAPYIYPASEEDDLVRGRLDG